MDKVNLVFSMFGHKLAAISSKALKNNTDYKTLMRQATILYNNTKAGQLTETNDGEYVFTYNADYINKYPKQFITFSMPVRKEEY